MSRTMYPKVKVRVQEQDDQYATQGQDFCFYPAKECEDDSNQPCARIPEFYVPNSPMATVSEPEGPMISKKTNNDNDKQNIRASLVPPPRAVLSSPDNDGMIGRKNRRKAGCSSVMKSNTKVQTMNPHSKVVRSRIKCESPSNRTKSGCSSAMKSNTEDETMNPRAKVMRSLAKGECPATTRRLKMTACSEQS